MFSYLGGLDRPRRALLYACFYAFFCNGFLALTLGSMLPDMRAAYRLDNAMGGLMLAAHSVGNLTAGFLSGVAGVYLGRRRTVVCLSALGFAGMLAIALTGAPGLLCAAFFCTGMGRGSVSNFNNATVNAVTGGSAAASNLMHALFAVGAITAPMSFLLLRRVIDWRAGVTLVAVLGALSVINLARLPASDDRPAPGRNRTGGFGFMRDPRFLVLGAMMLFYLCAEYAINGWLVSYIQHKDVLLAGFNATGEALDRALAAYSQAMATLMWSVILVGRLVCAWLSRRVSPKKLMLVASICEAACFAGLMLATSIPSVTLCVAGVGFFMSGICPMIYADAAPITNAYPLATGILLSFGSAGGIAMPALVGVLAQRRGFAGGMSAILAGIALLVLCAAVNLAMDRKGKNPASR